MRRIHHKVRRTILGFVDFFYPLFKTFMPLQTYRYAACGGANTSFSLFIYFIAYNFIFNKEIVQLGIFAFKPHIAALFFSFFASFPTGFYLSLYVVFQGSELRKRIQLFRYFLVALGCILINYVFLKLFVEGFGWYPTPSQVLTTGIVILFSYFSQRHFSFRGSVVKKEIDIKN